MYYNTGASAYFEMIIDNTVGSSTVGQLARLQLQTRVVREINDPSSYYETL